MALRPSRSCPHVPADARRGRGEVEPAGGSAGRRNSRRVLSQICFAPVAVACNNSGMKIVRLVALVLLAAFATQNSPALEKQPAADYRARRVALGNALHGGVA